MEVNSFNGLQPSQGSKTPVSNHQQSLTDLNDKENNYHRMSSNPGVVVGRMEDDYSKISQGYESGNQQRRESLSHHLSSYARDPELPLSRVGAGGGDDRSSSYHKGGDIGGGSTDQYTHQNQNFRPGEMRYTQDDQQEFRD